MDMDDRVGLYVCMFCMFQHGPFVLKRTKWERLLSHFVGMTLLAFVNLSLPVLPDWKRQQHEKSEIVAEAFPMLLFLHSLRLLRAYRQSHRRRIHYNNVDDAERENGQLLMAKSR